MVSRFDYSKLLTRLDQIFKRQPHGQIPLWMNGTSFWTNNALKFGPVFFSCHPYKVLPVIGIV